MSETRPAYTVGEVIYPRQFDEPSCADCPHSPRVHRYTVVSAPIQAQGKMAPSGCDGDGERGCPCRRYNPSAPVEGVQKPRLSKDEVWARYPNDAFIMLSEKESATVRCARSLCRARAWWGLTRANHKRCLFDIMPDGTRTGTSHWRTCNDPPPRVSKGGKKR